MKIKSSFLLIGLVLGLALFCHQLSFAQTVVGFWAVDEVKVGNKIMTPVAKWTKINPDGSYQSGNGWIQNSEGTWTFDDKNKSFRLIETNGIVERFGAFKVSFLNDRMIWERDEEGEKVIVKLSRVVKLPRATSDLLVGLWKLRDVSNNGNSQREAFDPDNKHYIFIRWDRIYVERTPKGEKATGYWHINAHKPEITFICHDPGQLTKSWRVSVNDLQLRMTGISDSNKDLEMLYERINDFPK
jgi:hypothetical protein